MNKIIELEKAIEYSIKQNPKCNITSDEQFLKLMVPDLFDKIEREKAFNEL